jgi:hypothetical protein
MNMHINYADIPKEERKRLGTKAFHETPQLRVVLFTAFFISFLFSSFFADSVLSKSVPFLDRLGFVAICTSILSVIIWTTFGRRRLKAEVERLRNA